jgi:hypothetical protein
VFAFKKLLTQRIFHAIPAQSTTTHAKPPLRHLSVSLEVEGVVSLPGLPTTSSSLVVTVTLAQSTRLFASSGKTAGFTVLVNGIDDPVDTGIAADGLVLRINEDDLEVLVGRVLIDPVGVQDTQIGAATSDTLFRSGF